MKTLLITGLLALAPLTEARAEYYRLWRGFPKAGLSQRDFLKGLNEKLLPAAQAMAKPAKLESYHPALLNQAAQAFTGGVSEIALLEYESEATYRAYRATPEGIAYGDLHWEMFEKDISKSLVAEAYTGELAIEKAYDVLGGSPDWKQGVTHVFMRKRPQGISDDVYFTSIRERIEALKTKTPLKALLVLVAQTYVMEYVLWSDASMRNLVQVPGEAFFKSELQYGTTLQEGMGVRYPLAPEASKPTNAPKIPKNAQANYDYETVTVGPARATLIQTYWGGVELSVNYRGYLRSNQTIDRPLRMGVLLNGQHKGDIPLSFSRGYTYAYISLGDWENGELELYFFDDEGNYDSDYGQNYRFSLHR